MNPDQHAAAAPLVIGAYLVRRLLQLIPIMLGVAVMVFLLFNWVGGDPAYILAGKMGNPEQIASIRRQLGIDQSYAVQLWIFLKQIVSFDFGLSWSTGEPVSQLLANRIGPSLTLLLPMLALQTVVAVTLALMVAFVRGSLLDRAVMLACTLGMSISILVYIILFQYWFAYRWGWFPVQGWGPGWVANLMRYAPLPILVGALVSLAPCLRLYRSIILDEVRQDYVRTARAKGLTRRRIVWVHVLRNAAIPIITDVMSSLPALLSGAFLIERFFSIPGLGREVILAVEQSDFPVIKAVTIYLAAATLLINLLTDLLYRLVDPRVQLR